MSSRSSKRSVDKNISNRVSETSSKNENGSRMSRSFEEYELILENEPVQDNIAEKVVEEGPTRLSHFRRSSLSDYRRQELEKSPLFKKIYTNETDLFKEEELSKTPSILITGFGMRNLQSLQNALRIEEERKR